MAQLKLNADWVVLSACNTIAGDKPGAEALSGLARAFFYAGARALLVSHWAVDSDAATRLTTTTFDILKVDPKLGRAEALRRAMLAYMTTPPIRATPIRPTGRRSWSWEKGLRGRESQSPMRRRLPCRPSRRRARPAAFPRRRSNRERSDARSRN